MSNRVIKTVVVTAAGILACILCWPLESAEAMAPPVAFSLEALGESAHERRGKSWSVTRVDDGIATYCASKIEGAAATFVNEDHSLSVGPDSEDLWKLVWAVLWSPTPKELMSAHIGEWGPDTARVEVVDGAPVYCYGSDSRLCVDEEIRRIEWLEIAVDDVRWRLRASRDGTRLQVSADGSLVARVAAEEC